MVKMRKPFRVGLFFCLFSLFFAGLIVSCSSDDDDADEDASAAPAVPSAGVPDHLVRKGYLTVCSDIPYPPFEYEDEDGEYSGFDIDLLRALAHEKNLEVAIVDTEFEGILLNMAVGTCDMVASALTITEERAKQVDFTQSYLQADQSLLVMADRVDEFGDLADLEGKVVAVQGGTTGEMYARKELSKRTQIKSYPGAGELFAALESGVVDAVLQDLPINAYRAVQSSNMRVVLFLPTGELYGFAVKKGEKVLLQMLNDGLDELHANGMYDDFYRKYFGRLR